MKEKIKHILEKSKHIDLQHDGAVPAAVLIPIFCRGGVSQVVFTKRTHLVRHHKGQISFPGGVQDSVDKSLEETALRETYEEIGVTRDDIEILGRLDQSLTVTNYLVTPFIGFIPHSYPFKLNPHEVEEIIVAPLSFILNPENVQKEDVEFEGRSYETDCYNYDGHIIWGATARIIHILRKTLMNNGFTLNDCDEEEAAEE